MGRKRAGRSHPWRGALQVVLCLVLVLALAAAGARAETAADQAARIQRRQAVQRRLPVAPAPPSGPASGVAPAAAAKAGGRCVGIRRIEVAGARLLRPGRVAAAVAPFEGRCLGLGELDGVLQALTLAYVGEGYVAARAYLPEQDLSGGVLRVAVVEGRLAAITMNGSAAAGRGERLTAFPGMVGRPVNLRDIEQGLEQMSRLPGVDAHVSIRPGRKPGESVLAVARRPGPVLYGDAGTDDLGSPATGIYEDHFQAGLADLLGLDERFTLGYQRSTGGGPLHLGAARPNGEGWSGSFEMPWGYWTFGLAASRLGYRSQLPAALGPIPTAGRTRTVQVSARRVIARDRVSKTTLGGTLTSTDTQSSILGNLIDVASYRLAVLRLELSHDRRLWGGAGRIALGWSRGLRVLGAVDDRRAPAGSPEGQFGKFDLSASFVRGIPLGATTLAYEGSLTAQWSGDRLFSSEQMSVGGPGSVRGLRDAVMFGNCAAVARQTLAVPVARAEDLGLQGAPFGAVEAYAGLDAGRVWGAARQGIAGGSIAGAAVGLRSIGGPVYFDVSYARIVAHSDGVRVGRNGLVAASLSVAF